MDRKKRLISSLALINITGKDAEELVDFLDFIDAPDDLIYLGAVLENITAALELPLIRDVAPHTKLVQRAMKYRSSAYFLLEKLQLHRDKIKFFRPMETNVKKAMQGYLSKHPIYVLLFMNSDKNQPFYNALQQILLFFPALIEQQTAKNPDVFLKEYEKRQICEIFREFSTESIITDWYGYIRGEKYNSLSKIIRLLQQLSLLLESEVYENKTRLLSRLNTLIQIFQLGLGIEKKRHNVKSRHGGSRQNKSPEIDGYTALTGEMLVKLTLPDIHDDEDLIYALWGSPSEPVDYEALYSGEDEQEQEVGDVYIFQTSQPLESYVQAFHGKRVSSAILNRITRQNNYLPLSLQMLSHHEYQLILDAIINEHVNISMETLIKQLILLTMLYTASPFERAREVLFATRFNDNDTPVQIGYEYSTHSWIIPALNLNYKTTGDFSEAQKAANLLRLPATELCRFKFDKLAKLKPPSQTPEKPCNKTNILSDDFSKYIADIGPGTLTKGRISNYLLVIGCAVFGQATTALLFNREPPGSMARSYYTSLHTSLLQQRYKILLDILATSVERKASTAAPAESYGWIGARYRPEMNQITAAITKIQYDLSRLQTKLTEPGKWIDFHNLYVTYQVFCQSLLTGMRPITTPLVQREQLVVSAGVFIRKEKAREDEFNTRHIPLCKTVLELISAYERHLMIIKSRLLRTNIKPASLPTLFYIEVNGKPQRFQPLLYQRVLNHYINLPPNLNRRLLRNYLEEQCVSHEIIDVALGHANIGEQYWGTYSTLSMRDIRTQLVPHMAEFARLLGIKTIAGLFT
ncbi:hypothetical protein SAMN06297280_3449 [Arsukibacterium tuosuense]|uniref:Uncharacterized protein n=1 Tax=Arsukibacterium tuosuense TaxID=1323745 RepID=A0A285JGX2_9GAMM|nr:hypothetical protein [Arsukibacterium tuosuense]SNY58626.1 hypothetical protein SAMN06297280_3449 [Arsukibacterium tuosuense]